MQWKGKRTSENIVDLRDEDSTSRKKSIGILPVLVLGAAVYFMGGDPRIVLSLLEKSLEQGNFSSEPRVLSDAEKTIENESKQFISVVLASLEDNWKKEFSNLGLQFSSPRLVLYRDAVETACGFGQAAAGPFYCPGDNQLYLDLSFLEELKSMGAAGDFAVAYVIAHEVGHHVQTILGEEDKLRKMQGRSDELEANSHQVSFELQADCFAGIWANAANKELNFIEEGDIEEGLRAAAAVGDDTIMRNAGREIRPESFTHGSSEQRMRAFRKGFSEGDLRSCRELA